MHKWLETVLNEQYQFVKCIRKTDNKEITVLEHKTLKKRIIKRTFYGNAEVYRKLVKLEHKNIPEILEVTESGDMVTILEEYIEGVTLSELIEDGVYVEKTVKKFMSELCDVLSFIHANNIVHRDIKPQNIMIDNSQTVKLIDFDSARVYKMYYPKDTEYLGTVGYAAPEQYGEITTDSRADIYSAGILINVMLTGKKPSAQLYKGKLRKVIEKCIHVSPDKRFQTAEQLKRSLKL